ncbi:superoxide dismutase [Erythrobacter sp. NE805]|uniref:superoxide dismutase n=1 Tax=Erythrobacter sp. NE805 TaxID=3389875 RepID=UPI00396B3CF4
MVELTRRGTMGGLVTGAAGLALAGQAASAQGPAAAAAKVPAYAANHQPRPLPFDPKALRGLSEKLIVSHWQNNYGGSVRALNTIETRLGEALADPDFPALVHGGLKREELNRTGSVILHELYFGALGGDGVAAGTIREALVVAFGSFAAWERDFRRTAMALAGGSGWCVLAYNAHTGTLHNHWGADHMHAAAAAAPLIALDMYEHSYHIDYGANAGAYVDAFMSNLDWSVIEARYRGALAVT